MDLQKGYWKGFWKGFWRQFWGNFVKLGERTFLCLVIAVVLDNWEVINLDAIPFGNQMVNYIYLYVLTGAVAVLLGSRLLYVRRGVQALPAKPCPKCDGPLQMEPQYTCPICGKITFED